MVSKILTAPVNFRNLSDSEYDQLGRILVDVVADVVGARGMKLETLVLDQRGIVAKILWDCNLPSWCHYKSREKTEISNTNKYLGDYVAAPLLMNAEQIFDSKRILHPYFNKVLVSCTAKFSEARNLSQYLFLSAIIERDRLKQLSYLTQTPLAVLKMFENRLQIDADGHVLPVERIEYKPIQSSPAFKQPAAPAFEKPTIPVQKKPSTPRVSLEYLKTLSPYEFEKFVGQLYQKMGFNTTLTSKSNDGGIDVIAVQNGEVIFIQCKRFKNSYVGVTAVRELYGVVNRRHAKKGVVICTSRFTVEARKFAEGIEIELVDGKALEILIKRHY